MLNQTDAARYFTFPREFLKGVFLENSACKIKGGDYEWDGVINVMNSGDRIVISTGWVKFLASSGLRQGDTVKVTYREGYLKFAWDPESIKAQPEVSRSTAPHSVIRVSISRWRKERAGTSILCGFSI